MKDRIKVINTLRGVSALAVCLYHFVVSTYIDDLTLRSIFEYGKKGVQIFFIISGIVIPLSMIDMNYSYSKIFKFLKVRFLRIEPPYLAAVVLGILYLNIRNYIPSSQKMDVSPSLNDIFLHIGYLIPFVENAKWIIKVFWTLSIEFQYYIFLSLTFPLLICKKAALTFIFFIFLIILPILNSTFHLFFFWGSYFGLGILYALYIRDNINYKIFMFYSVLLSISIYFHQGILDLIIAVFSIIVIHYFRNYSFKIGDFFGNISYSLYLTHSLTGLAFINFMSSRVTSTWSKFSVEILAIAISIFFAYYFWKFVEKPFHKLAMKLKINK